MPVPPRHHIPWLTSSHRRPHTTCRTLHPPNPRERKTQSQHTQNAQPQKLRKQRKKNKAGLCFCTTQPLPNIPKTYSYTTLNFEASSPGYALRSQTRPTPSLLNVHRSPAQFPIAGPPSDRRPPHLIAQRKRMPLKRETRRKPSQPIPESQAHKALTNPVKHHVCNKSPPTTLGKPLTRTCRI